MAEGEGGLLEFQVFLLKGPHMDLLRPISSELQQQGSNLKGTSGIWGGTKVSAIRVRAGGGQLFLKQKGGQRPCSFSEPSPSRATELAGRGVRT